VDHTTKKTTLPTSNISHQPTKTLPYQYPFPFPLDRSRYPRKNTMDPLFRFTRLDAYQVATAFVVSADLVAAALPRGRSYLSDQLRRAALSIQANIAEGAGEFSAPDKARFYRIALRSATECVALLDSVEGLELRDREALEEARIMLSRIVSMTTKLVRRFG